MAEIDRHEPGQTDAAALTAVSWSRPQLEGLFVDVHTLLELINSGKVKVPPGVPSFSPEELQQLQRIATQEKTNGITRLVKRGALLHTDVALLVPDATDPAADAPAVPKPHETPIAPRGSSIRDADGRNQGMRYSNLHWDFARMLLDAVKPDEFARVWYRATAAWLTYRHQLSEATPHLQRAREIFPADAGILFYNGGLYEMLAAPRIQGFIRTTALPDGVFIDVASERTNLRRAEGFFRRALALDPDLTEARVRLGRVLGVQGRHEEAIRELQAANVAPDDSLLRYYTALFLGADEEALGHADRARDAFGRASALYPRAQSPHLALSQLAWRTGDRPGALRAIQPVLALPADEDQRADPWWDYYDGAGRDADSQLDRLRGLQNGSRQ